MSVKRLDLIDTITLETGTEVQNVWVGKGGPIALLEGYSESGEHFRARLDLQKEMFIDSMPTREDLDTAHTAAEYIRHFIGVPDRS